MWRFFHYMGRVLIAIILYIMPILSIGCVAYHSYNSSRIKKHHIPDPVMSKGEFYHQLFQTTISKIKNMRLAGFVPLMAGMLRVNLKIGFFHKKQNTITGKDVSGSVRWVHQVPKTQDGLIFHLFLRELGKTDWLNWTPAQKDKDIFCYSFYSSFVKFKYLAPHDSAVSMNDIMLFSYDISKKLEPQHAQDFLIKANNIYINPKVFLCLCLHVKKAFFPLVNDDTFEELICHNGIFLSIDYKNMGFNLPALYKNLLHHMPDSQKKNHNCLMIMPDTSMVLKSQKKHELPLHVSLINFCMSSRQEYIKDLMEQKSKIAKGDNFSLLNLMMQALFTEKIKMKGGFLVRADEYTHAHCDSFYFDVPTQHFILKNLTAEYHKKDEHCIAIISPVKLTLNKKGQAVLSSVHDAEITITIKMQLGDLEINIKAYIKKITVDVQKQIAHMDGLLIDPCQNHEKICKLLVEHRHIVSVLKNSFDMFSLFYCEKITYDAVKKHLTIPLFQIKRVFNQKLQVVFSGSLDYVSKQDGDHIEIKTKKG